MSRTIVIEYVRSTKFQDFLKQLIVGVFQMGTLGYQNAVVELLLTTPLEEVDEKVPTVYMASTELSTTPPTPLVHYQF